MQEITDQHLTACTRALLDHIDTHLLPFPVEIGKPTYGERRWGLRVDVIAFDADAWVDSITVVAEATRPIPGYVDDVMSIVHGTLPDTGVRVTINSIRPVVAVAS